jgi:hypothetical protein
MSNVKYPKTPKATKRKPSATEADKYQRIVKSHPTEATYNTKQESKKRKLKKDKTPTIDDPQVQELAKKAVKKW